MNIPIAQTFRFSIHITVPVKPKFRFLDLKYNSITIAEPKSARFEVLNSGIAEVSSLLIRYTVSTGMYLLTFIRFVMTWTSGSGKIDL